MPSTQEYNQKYYKTNKDELKQAFSCPCGGKYKLYNRSHHHKSKKHQAWVADSRQQELVSLKKEIQRLKEQQS